MTNEHTPSETPDGSTNVTEEQKEYTEELSDGSSTSNAPKSSEKDSDTVSGGEPEEP